MGIHEEIKRLTGTKILFTPYAVKRMNDEEEMILKSEVEKVLLEGELIEDYPEDSRGHSCLLCTDLGNRYIHVVCAPKEEYVAVITVYVPEPEKWESNFRVRKEER